MNGTAYSNWATAAAGLLALTYGLDRVLDNPKDGMGWAITAVGAPVALTGLVGWTTSLVADANQ